MVFSPQTMCYIASVPTLVLAGVLKTTVCRVQIERCWRERTHRLHDEIMDKRARSFVFVERQTSTDDHVPRISPSRFIGKERQAHHPVKFIVTYFICSLINGMRSGRISIISIFAHKSVSTDISHIIHFTDTKRSHLVVCILFCRRLESLLKNVLFPSGLS